MIGAVVIAALVWWGGEDMPKSKRDHLMCVAAVSGGMAPPGTACVVHSDRQERSIYAREDP